MSKMPLTKSEAKSIAVLNKILEKESEKNEILYSIIINLILNYECIENYFINNTPEIYFYFNSKESKELNKYFKGLKL